MRIGVIHGFDGSHFHLDYARTIVDEVKRLGHEGLEVSVNDLSQVDSLDAAYLMTHGLRLNYSELAKRVRMINSYKSQANAIDKVKTSRILLQEGIPTPETVISDDFGDVEALVEKAGTVVLKYPWGCAGYGHFFLHRNGRLKGVTKQGEFEVKKLSDRVKIGENTVSPPYYAQEFISSRGDRFSNDRVYRMYVVGEKVGMGSIRVIDDVHDLSKSVINIAQGAHYIFMDKIDQRMQDAALMTAGAVGFDVGVVDILCNVHGAPYVIECDCDGRLMAVDRSFRKHTQFNDSVNYDRMIAERLLEIGAGASYRK